MVNKKKKGEVLEDKTEIKKQTKKISGIDKTLQVNNNQHKQAKNKCIKIILIHFQIVETFCKNGFFFIKLQS